MFEVVGLSKNEILKEKLAEFFDRTSMASSSQNKNISSVRDNYDKNMPKSGISSINKQLISSTKSNDENDERNNSSNKKII